jgi:hypothetical protein
MIVAAAMKAEGRPVFRAVHFAKLVNQEVDLVGLIKLSPDVDVGSLHKYYNIIAEGPNSTTVFFRWSFITRLSYYPTFGFHR